MQVNVRRQYPQVRLKQRAFLPEYASYPDYVRDAGISVVASLLFGLLLLWLYDFLTRPARHSMAHDIKQVFMAAPETRALGTMADVPLPQPATVAALEHQLPRELSQAEVMELLRSAGPDSRLLIVCLLSGLTAGEARVLRWDDIDKDAGTIHVRGESGRTIPVTPPLLAAIEAVMPAVPGVDTPVWQDTSGKPLAPDDMASMLVYSAHDAGLIRPPEVTPEAVRHTCIASLVRKGVRLNDLARLAGHISPATLAAYGFFLTTRLCGVAGLRGCYLSGAQQFLSASAPVRATRRVQENRLDGHCAGRQVAARAAGFPILPGGLTPPEMA